LTARKLKIDYLKQEIAESGFARYEQLLDPLDVDLVDEIITALMEKSCSRKKDSNHGHEFSSQPELIKPSAISPALRASVVFSRCQKIATEYFGSHGYYLFDHAIYKLPQSTTTTPWHQDQAYLGVDIPGLHFWIPFQNTSQKNGTLCFVKGSHKKLLPHIFAFPENKHVLTTADKPQSNIYPMDLAKGDVSIHTELTWHFSGENHTNDFRKAWIIHFSAMPAWHKRWLQVKSKLSQAFFTRD
jgi:hypothetical protein